MADETTGADHQYAVAELHDAYVEYDKRRLAELDDTQLAEQYQARQLVYDYVDRLWEDAKRDGLNPAVLPDWQGVAAMRDLAMSLWTAAGEEFMRRD